MTILSVKILIILLVELSMGLRRRRRVPDFESYSSGLDNNLDGDDNSLGPMISRILDDSSGQRSSRDGHSSVATFEVDDGRVVSDDDGSSTGGDDYQNIVQQVERPLDVGGGGGHSTTSPDRATAAKPRTIVVKRRSHRRDTSDFISHAPLSYTSQSSNVVEDVDEVISLVADYIDLERGVGDKLARFIEDLAIAVKSKSSCTSKRIELSSESIRQFADDYEQLGEDLKDDRDILTNVRRYLELLSDDPKAHRALRKLMKPLDRLVRNSHALQDVNREIGPVVEELQRSEVLGEFMTMCSSFDEIEMEGRLRSIDHVYSDLSSGFDSLAYNVIVSTI